jgi:hypothetical protein
LAQIPLRVDMVYWPTPSAPPVSPRGAAAVRRINPGAAAGVGTFNRNAVQGAAVVLVRPASCPSAI